MPTINHNDYTLEGYKLLSSVVTNLFFVKLSCGRFTEAPNGVNLGSVRPYVEVAYAYEVAEEMYYYQICHKNVVVCNYYLL